MPRLKEMAGNWVALGSVILMTPGQCCFRKASSCPVSGRTARNLELTMPVTLLTGALAWPAQERATASARSKPSTASVKSLMKLRRRSSPSVKTSNPSSFCLFRTRVMWRSSSSRNRSASPDASRRTSSNSAGRRKLPTWSARYWAGILLLDSLQKLNRVGIVVAFVGLSKPGSWLLAWVAALKPVRSTCLVDTRRKWIQYCHASRCCLQTSARWEEQRHRYPGTSSQIGRHEHHQGQRGALAEARRRIREIARAAGGIGN